MGKKNSGVNTKVAAANDRKAKLSAEKEAKNRLEAEKEASKQWAKGANQRGAKRQEEEELKRQALDAKQAEKKKLLEEEEALLGNIKGPKKKTKAQKDMDKPWEAALKPAQKKNNRGSRVKTPATPSAPAAKKPTVESIEESMKKSNLTFQKHGDNLNRQKSEDAATNIDDAISLLSKKQKEDERHPERRAKAAFKAYEEAQLPIVRADYPGLKLSQYKQRIFEKWQKSPENPLNQKSIAYNAKK